MKEISSTHSISTFFVSTGNIVLVLLGFLLLQVNAFSQTDNTTITWTGAVDEDWSNADNWSPAQVPTSPSDEVVIPQVSSGNYPISYSGLTWNNEGSLTVEENASLTVIGGGTLQNGIACGVNGAVTNYGSIDLLECINGINIQGSLYNHGSMEIITCAYGLFHQNGYVENYGSILISGADHVAIYLIQGDFLFTNESSGLIVLEGVHVGISNQSTILNNGEIQINTFNEAGIVNFDGIENNGTIGIFDFGSKGSIYNGGGFENNTNAVIYSVGKIDDQHNLANYGMISVVAPDDSHIHNNQGTIIYYGPEGSCTVDMGNPPQQGHFIVPPNPEEGAILPASRDGSGIQGKSLNVIVPPSNGKPSIILPKNGKAVMLAPTREVD